jgi:hypothetical protein
VESLGGLVLAENQIQENTWSTQNDPIWLKIPESVCKWPSTNLGEMWRKKIQEKYFFFEF